MRAAIGVVLVALVGLVVERRRRRRAAGPGVAHNPRHAGPDPRAIAKVADPDDLIAKVSAAHEQLRGELAKLRGLPTGTIALDEQARLVAQRVVVAASQQLAAEDAVLWPTVRAHVGGGDALADRAVGEVTELRRSLQRLDQDRPGDPVWDGLAAEAVDRAYQLGVHVRADVLPPLSLALDERARTRLGRQLDAARAAAPTRPHPGGPDPAAHPHLGRAVAAADHLADRLTGRREA